MSQIGAVQSNSGQKDRFIVFGIMIDGAYDIWVFIYVPEKY